MKEDDFKKIKNRADHPVKWKNRKFHVIDHYTDNTGKTIAVVSSRAANGGIAYGNNVPIEHLEEFPNA